MMGVMPARLRAIAMALALAVLLSACSVRYMYSQLDWIVPWYVRDYVTLNTDQRALLARRLAQRLDWHCRSQLPAYAVLLREVVGTAAAASADIGMLDRHADEVEALLRGLMEALADDAAELLATLSDEQVAALFANLDRRNDKVRDEYLNGSAAELRARQTERMEKRLRRWLGGLNGEQRRLVEAWSARSVPVAEQWFDHRIAWQRRLAEALHTRHARPEFDADVAALLVEPDAQWPAQYRTAVLRNRALTLELVRDLHHTATPRQRARLIRELESLAHQFERTACGDAAATARPARGDDG
jgi:DNA-binding transcriptional ArsR family regulator